MDDQPLRMEGPPLQAPLTMLLGLILGALLGSMIGSVLALGTAQLGGFDPASLLEGAAGGSPRPERDMLRWINLINHFLTFTVSTLVVIYLFTRSGWARFLGLTRPPDLPVVGLAVLFILAGFPVAQSTYWLNQQLPAPEWATEMEQAATGMLESVLTMESPGEFLFTLLVVGVAPALGEELLFRGGIQRSLERLSDRPHLAIWSTALLFSAVHFQFEGFIPRTLLGAALGYLYFWTHNLWVPIAAHFAFNGGQVVAQYLSDDPAGQLQIEQVESPQWGLALAGLAIMWVSAHFLLRTVEEQASRTIEN